MRIRNLTKRLINKALNCFGYAMAPKGLGYFNADAIIKAAAKSGLSICEYLERNNVGGVGKRRDCIVQKLGEVLPAEIQTLVEIGAGTGMYLEEIVRIHRPHKCEIYETSIQWVNYLSQKSSKQTEIRCHNADGKTLSQTPSSSVDVAFAHAVFVYLPMIETIGYLEEMVRVVKPGGLIVFDCFVGEHFGMKVIKDWRQDSFGWTFPVVLSKGLVEEFIENNRLQQVSAFDVKYHASLSTYYILKKSTNSA